MFGDIFFHLKIYAFWERHSAYAIDTLLVFLPPSRPRKNINDICFLAFTFHSDSISIIFNVEWNSVVTRIVSRI